MAECRWHKERLKSEFGATRETKDKHNGGMHELGRSHTPSFSYREDARAGGNGSALPEWRSTQQTFQSHASKTISASSESSIRVRYHNKAITILVGCEDTRTSGSHAGHLQAEPSRRAGLFCICRSTYQTNNRHLKAYSIVSQGIHMALTNTIFLFSCQFCSTLSHTTRIVPTHSPKRHQRVCKDLSFPRITGKMALCQAFPAPPIKPEKH